MSVVLSCSKALTVPINNRSLNVLFGTHEVKTEVLNIQRGELTICSAQTQEPQSKGNFSATLSMHRRKKRDLKHGNKTFTSYSKINKVF